MQAAEKTARRFGHHAIDTEHLLCALVADDSGKAVDVLKQAGLDQKNVKTRIEYTAPYASSKPLDESQPLKPTAQTQSAIDYAIDEARNLNQNYVGSEHLLIGLLREGGGLAAEILREFGLTLAILRKETVAIITAESASRAPPPVTDAERAFFLALYKSAVTFYKPRIEAKTGVELGKIAVWDHSCLAEHVLANRRARISSRKTGFIERLFLRDRVRHLAETIQPFYEQRAAECVAAYYRGAIYVSFVGETAHEHLIASTTVHEISHALWERIAEEEFEGTRAKARIAGTVEEQKCSLFVEGFASYAELIRFLDVYPPQIRDLIQQYRHLPESPHARGLRHVKRLIKEFGPDLFLEIPKKWRTLPMPENE
jgi:Clp amino terminal domain, pathogenicity island component